MAKRIDWEFHFVWVGILVTLLLVGIYGAVDCRTETFCNAHGYPSSKVNWNLNTYCIKRQDQTDIVVPVDDIPE